MSEARRLGFEASDLLAWLGGMRWFGGGKPKIDRAFALGGPWDEKVFWLAVSADGREYNVPVVVTEDGPVDAAEHPAGQRALLALATASERVEATAVVGESDARLASEPRAAGAAASGAHKLTGEQSNTSVIYELADSERAIVKVFRVLSPGENPDVFLTGVLSDSGTVPRLLGNARMAWAGQVADVLVAQEFLAGSQDAWRTVTAQVPGADGRQFDPDRPVQTPEERDSIERLGALTRKIHEELAARCGTSEADAASRARLRRGPSAPTRPWPSCRGWPLIANGSTPCTRRRKTSRGRPCRGFTATTTWAKSWTRPAEDGRPSISKASRSGRSQRGPSPTWPFATSPGWSEASATRRA